MQKAVSLISSYLSGSIPREGGFIIAAFFDSKSSYSVYEITAYKTLETITREEDGIVFKTEGNRLHMLIEPHDYTKKNVEPIDRPPVKSIPYKLCELDIINCNDLRIMIPKEPQSLYSSFKIFEKNSDYFSFIFPFSENSYYSIEKFILSSLQNDCNFSKNDSIEIAKTLILKIKKFTIWRA